MRIICWQVNIMKNTFKNSQKIFLHAKQFHTIYYYFKWFKGDFWIIFLNKWKKFFGKVISWKTHFKIPKNSFFIMQKHFLTILSLWSHQDLTMISTGCSASWSISIRWLGRSSSCHPVGPEECSPWLHRSIPVCVQIRYTVPATPLDLLCRFLGTPMAADQYVCHLEELQQQAHRAVQEHLCLALMPTIRRYGDERDAVKPGNWSGFSPANWTTGNWPSPSPAPTRSPDNPVEHWEPSTL